MTDPLDRTSTPHGEAVPKPAASLSDVKIQRPGRQTNDERNAKPGDLTSILAERRQDTDPPDRTSDEGEPGPEGAPVKTGAPAEQPAARAESGTGDAATRPKNDDSAPPTASDKDDRGSADPGSANGTRQANGSDAGNGHLSHPPSISAGADHVEDRRADAVVAESKPDMTESARPPGAAAGPARAKSKTLRERLKAQRTTPSDTPVEPQPSDAATADPKPPNAEQKQHPASEAADRPAGAAANGAGGAPPNEANPPTPPSTPSNAEETVSAAPETATDDGDSGGGGGSIRERMARRRGTTKDDAESAADVVTDALLRKRMAAVLLSETKRREERVAKQDEKSQSDGAANAQAGEAEIVAAPQGPKWSPPAKPADIVRYWTLARRGRRLPALSDLDLDEVARNWPDSLLLRYVPESRHLELEKSLVRLSKADPGQPDAYQPQIDYTPDVIDWVVHQGLVVTKDGNPVRATDEFDVEDGIARYRVVALPLGEDGSDIDHILCHLEPA